MKTLSIILVIFSFSTVVSAQLIQKEDGKLYNQTGNLYSGTYIEYYPSGNKRIEMSITDGQKNGKTCLYFDNLKTKEVRSFSFDLMDGVWKTFNENGIKIGEAGYKNGIKHGRWLVWDDNGVLRYEMEYANGEKTGLWSIWDTEGKLVQQKSYSTIKIENPKQ